jgi:hypothetical protein
MKKPASKPAPKPTKTPIKKAVKALPAPVAQFVEFEVVAEPQPILPVKKCVHLVNTFPTLEQIEQAISATLNEEETAKRKSALACLRSGVLFYLLKVAMGVNGRKYTGFWEACETKFGIKRATISKKMRLANIWANEVRAGEKGIKQLALVTDCTDITAPGVKLALDWIGDRSVSDLYREYGLVTYGPVGGAVNRPDGTTRRTKGQIAQDDFEALAPAQCVVVTTQLEKLLSLKGPKGESAVLLLDETGLEKLKLAALDLHNACLEAETRRKTSKK